MSTRHATIDRAHFRSLLEGGFRGAIAERSRAPERGSTWRRPKVGSVATQGRLVQQPSKPDSTPGRLHHPGRRMESCGSAICETGGDQYNPRKPRLRPWPPLSIRVSRNWVPVVLFPLRLAGVLPATGSALFVASLALFVYAAAAETVASRSLRAVLALGMVLPRSGLATGSPLRLAGSHELCGRAGGTGPCGRGPG